LGRVARAGADVGKAKLLEDLPDCALVVGDAEALGDETLKINAPPAHDPVHGPIRAGLDKAGQVRLLVG
jgi:hypothetical protein